jgi:hypothetical protein
MTKQLFALFIMSGLLTFAGCNQGKHKEAPVATPQTQTTEPETPEMDNEQNQEIEEQTSEENDEEQKY